MGANWKPLEETLGALRCVGFMFMGRLNGIYQYKHGISRRYLFLDYEGRAYESAGRNQFREIAFEEALGGWKHRWECSAQRSKRHMMPLSSGGKQRY